MKLEIKNNLISIELLEELGITSFLDSFDIEMPLIPSKILNKLDSKSLKNIYFDLSNISKKEIELNKLIKSSQKLPCLDWVIPAIKNKSMTAVDCHQLITFINTCITIEKLEKTKLVKSSPLKKIKSLIGKDFNLENGQMHVIKEENKIKNEIETLKKDICILASRYENEIFKILDVKMIYPWPKEITYTPEMLKKIKASGLLNYKKTSDYLSLTYLPPKSLEEKTKAKEKLENELVKLYGQVLKKFNTELNKYYKDFLSYYEKRVERTYLYILQFVAKKNKYVIPSLEKDCTFNLKKGILPSLLENRKDKYIPLNIDLTAGSSVLFGANMAGKTSVLKSIHFFSLITCLGLPVPAKSLSIHYPTEIKMHLKSSGTIKNNLSSFGEELNFFAGEFKSGSIINVDELFQTTNPIAGLELSTIFLNHFKSKNIIFFCTTQYPGILDNKDINLYKMKDISETHFKSAKDITDLLDNMPYTIEKITGKNKGDIKKEGQKALLLAANIISNKKIKNDIQKKVQG